MLTELEVVPLPRESGVVERGSVHVAPDLHRVPRVHLNHLLVLKEPEIKTSGVSIFNKETYNVILERFFAFICDVLCVTLVDVVWRP